MEYFWRIISAQSFIDYFKRAKDLASVYHLDTKKLMEARYFAESLMIK